MPRKIRPPEILKAAPVSADGFRSKSKARSAAHALTTWIVGSGTTVVRLSTGGDTEPRRIPSVAPTIMVEAIQVLPADWH